MKHGGLVIKMVKDNGYFIFKLSNTRVLMYGTSRRPTKLQPLGKFLFLAVNVIIGNIIRTTGVLLVCRKYPFYTNTIFLKDNLFFVETENRRA